MESEEILDLVDDNDQVIGQIKRGEMSALVPGGGKYVRAPDIFIMNPDGKVWVPVRSMHKSIAPGGLDFSVGGHVESGETYEQTAIRELEEEAGIGASVEQLELIANDPPVRTHISRLYLLRTVQTPRLNDEHTDGNWMGVDELQTSLEHGTFAKDSLLPKLELLKEYLSSHV